jgi:hypothetical protein
MTSTSSSAIRFAEASLTTLAGAALGGAAGLLGGVPVAIATGVSAGVNGAFGGYRQVYDWRRAKGWFAFVTDSTWGLLGTTLGNLLNVVNLARRESGYRADFSFRQNRHVFERGAAAKRGFAFTHGHVISNAATGRESLGEERRPFIDRHEGLHVWQSRLFGPIYQLVYVIWFAGGAAVGATAWALKRQKPKMRKMVETAAYYDNPFEFWAYKHDGHWENNSAEPTLKWRRPKWLEKKGGAGAGAGSPPGSPPAPPGAAAPRGQG